MPYKDDASDEDDEHLVGYTAPNGSSYDPNNTDHGYGDDGDNQGESEGQMLSSQRMMMEGMSHPPLLYLSARHWPLFEKRQ